MAERTTLKSQQLQWLQHLIRTFRLQTSLPAHAEQLSLKQLLPQLFAEDARAFVLLDAHGRIETCNPVFQARQPAGNKFWLRANLQGFNWTCHVFSEIPHLTLQVGEPLKSAVSETRIRQYLSAMTDVILVMDREGRHLEIAPTEPTLFYRPSQEMLGKTMHDLFPKVFADRFVSRIHDALQGEQEVELEYPLTLQDHEVWFGARFIPLSRETILLISRDITEKKKAEIALRESERRFQFAADHAPVLIWMSGLDGTATFFNQRWLEFTGRSPLQEASNGWMEGIHPEDLSHCLTTFQQNFELHRPFEMEFRLRRFDGEHRWIVNRGTPRYTPEGEFKGFIGACIDIHDRKLAEAALQLSEQRLRVLSESQKRFVADAAHELRTPLTSIQGNLDILTRFPDLSEEEKKEITQDVQKEAIRLGRLVQDMLQLAKGDAGTPLREVVFDLEPVVSGACKEIQRLYPRHQFHVHAQTLPLNVSGDPDRLRQLVVILLENAAKYTPRKGQISVDLQIHADTLLLKVRDNGIGIAPQDLERVFERFFRADPSRFRGEDPGGTGLGLSIAQWIVREHRGKIWLESELGEGTTVHVELPRALPDGA
ncbi:PAS domain-containing sensor histidine kinase [Deinococcus cellulosilyticus]|uniref:histidine kinase n=1 Tax=Deinococcus cellulosilyticus (strain DSM 18568 / NBRC 106333 / KACC 11606 / 5516J-15) TaxID=1223518 RepID=A0A511N5J3_DEIC1|nr:PAS domain-containing sensor histidine kinase [Deinococcus cellulosilyticus]GEM48125.1 PAS domain-containing sensor histidine kinase [Deinococcus cellulosilyticus NBRC 106333 = KACC 11606]